MRLFKNRILIRLAVLASILGIAGVSYGQEQKRAFSNIRIKNFGQMDDRFYRGAQPEESDFKDLTVLGVKTVIDLREDPESYEKRDVEALGMRYINIPMPGRAYPTTEQVDTFLKIVDDPTTGRFFVHCAAGKHRTGVMGAVYRFTHNHWDYDQVYSEMKSYDFYTRWGHGAFKQFVQDYWNRLHTSQNVGATLAAAQVTK